MDRRTRAARRWAAIRAGFAAQLGREPSADQAELLDVLADVSLEREVLRARRLAGERVDPTAVTGLASELRRVLRLLGLDGNGASAERSLEDLMR